MFINYAHRGASHYAPENTLAAFYKGLEMGANGIETDVQRTLDGVLVLHHDDNLTRTAGVEKTVPQLTFAELRALDFGRFFSPVFAGERILTLEEFLIFFGGKPVQFAIEIKQHGIEQQTLALCDRYLSKEKYIITSFMLQSILTLAGFEDAPHLGYLAQRFDKTEIDLLLEAKVGQYCPYAPELDNEMMVYLRSKGLNIRAWGISDETIMRKTVSLGVDGMTVNFPDKLHAVLYDF